MVITIKVMGAAGGEVTGSAYLVETERAKVLVDAGLFQGGKRSEEKNKLSIGAMPATLDCVLLTHAHLDHTGRLPLLIKQGFRGPVYATSATFELTDLVLRDAAKLQAQDAAHSNKRHPNKEPILPLYDIQDVEQLQTLAKSVPYCDPIVVADGVTARFFEAGHMLGSTSIELQVEDKVILFSGDLGPTNLPIIRTYEQHKAADLVFMESTYGDRDHRPYSETVAEFESLVKKAASQNGKILIPTFAIGRAQQALYHLAIMFHEQRVSPFPVYLDSPMAIEASKVFAKHPDLFDEELINWQKKGLLPLNRSYFKTSQTSQDSKQLNQLPGPCMILAGSGMCNGGRILHHFVHNISNPNTTIIIFGFQSEGSLGRALVDDAKQVTIFGVSYEVNATVSTLNGFSAHAGQSELLNWLSSLAAHKPKVVITHGENLQRQTLAEKIGQRFNLSCTLPQIGDLIEL